MALKSETQTFQRFFSKGRRTAVAALLMAVGASAWAQAEAVEPLMFGAVIANDCESNTWDYALESAALTAWAASFAAKTAVSFVDAAVEKATERRDITRTAKAPGYLYEWGGTAWQARSDACVRVWLGRKSASALPTAPADYAGQAGVADRWLDQSFAETPYLYGEFRLIVAGGVNVAALQPVVLYARNPPEAAGFWRALKKLTLNVDLQTIGADKPFMTYNFEWPDLDKPMMLRDRATHGLAGSWGTLPSPVQKAGSTNQRFDGFFTASVTLISSSTGSLLATAASESFKAEKQTLISALIPKAEAVKAKEDETAILAAFDARSKVLDEEAKLSTSSPADRPKQELALLKAKYLADQAYRSAGFPPPYNVTLP